MSFRSEILRILANPTTAYLVFLGGGILATAEFLRPSRGLAGIPGAVLVTIALYALAQQPLNYYGVSLVILSLYLVLSSLCGRSYIAPLLSGGTFLAGSALLLSAGEGIHMVAAALGGMFVFGCHWLLRIAYRARLAKRFNG